MMTMEPVNDASDYEELSTDELDDTDDNHSRPSWMPFLKQGFLCSSIWTLYFLYGLQFGTPTVLIPQLRKEVRSSTEIDDEIVSWITSMFAIGALPWIFFVPLISNFVGKKRTFIFTSIVTVIGFLVIYFSNSVSQLLIGEFVLGILLGALQTTAPITISEYTSPKYRGLFMTIKSASGFWGIWVSNFIGTFWHWRIITIVAFICSAYTLTIFIWPESPFWLARKGRFKECGKAHRWLKGTSCQANKELRNLVGFYKLERKKYDHKSIIKKSFFARVLKHVRDKAFYKPLSLCIILAFQYCFTGKLVCSMYAIEILKKIFKNDKMAYRGMLILDGVTVFGAYCGCFLSRYFKRRTFLLSTSALGISFLYCFSLYLYLVSKSIIFENSIVTISLLSLYSIFVTSGPMMLITSLFGELISVKYQRSTTIIYGFFSDSVLMLSLKFAPLVFRTLSLWGTFLCFAALFNITTFVLYKYLPETKDKTLHEIENNYGGKSIVTENKSILIPKKNSIL